MTIRLFRSLLIAEVVFLLAWMAFGFFGDPFLPEHLRQLDENGPTSTSPVLGRIMDWILLPATILHLIALLLLWRIRRIGRVLYATSFLFDTVFVASLAYTVSSGVLCSLEIYSGLVSSAILVTSFLPPLNSHFENQPDA